MIGRGRVPLVGPGDGDRSTASPSSAATRWTTTNVFIATGDSGMGMTHGTIAGMLLTDLILGRENPWAKLYDPSREPVCAADEFVKREPQRRRAVRRLADAAATSSRVDEIGPDSGAVVRRGLSKVAVYRDERRRAARAARRSARTSAASCSGTAPRRPGTAPATARASTPTARSSTGRRTATSRQWSARRTSELLEGLNVAPAKAGAQFF